MSILALFRCSIGECGLQHKFPNGSPDKEGMCGVVGERELARWRHKGKSSIKNVERINLFALITLLIC